MRLLYLQELFGQMGNTGDLRMLLQELRNFRDWQRSLRLLDNWAYFEFNVKVMCVCHRAHLFRILVQI